MTVKKRAISCLLCLLILLPINSLADTWKIGIRAIRGEDHLAKSWQPWVDWLNSQFEEDEFEVVPFYSNNLEIKNLAELDFILTNQSQFFYLNESDIRWLASLNSPLLGGQATQIGGGRIGSIIAVRSDSDYYSLQDLNGKTLSAVNQTALGGFLLGHYEFHKLGMSEGESIHYQYTGFPIDQTLLDLKAGRVEGAIAPTCLLETLISEGLIDEGEFRVLGSEPNALNQSGIHPNRPDLQNTDSNNSNETILNCQSSTQLLPGWSLAAMPNVPDALATELVVLLLTQSPNDLPQWMPPYSSTNTDKLLRQLNRHPKQDLAIIIRHWFLHNKYLVFFVLFFVLFNYLWISYQVHRKSKALAKAYQENLRYKQYITKSDRLRLIGEMTAGIAHEINQPLTAISMYMEGIKKQTEKLNSKDSRLPIMNQILLQVERSKQIMQNLTSWVKGKNKDSEQVAQVLLYELLNDTSQFMINTTGKNTVIKIDCDKDILLELKKTMFEEVICNCLLNAIQAGASQINLEVEKRQREVKLAIIDNGSGFSQQQLDFPFVPFRSSKEEGLGLGLVICKRLIETLHGTLTIANRENERGAIVSIVLPSKN